MSETSATRAYTHLRHKLASGQLSAGTWLRYGPIGREIGLSATPVREAVGRLASEGLVELRANHGAIVRAPQREELVELYEVREALESIAAGKTAERCSIDDLDELEKRIDALRGLAIELRDSGRATLTVEGMQRFMGEDLSFHLTILEIAGNQRLLKMVNTLQLMSRIFLDFKRPSHGLAQIVDAYKMHRRIFRAIRRRDKAGATRMMAQHIQMGMRNTLRMYDKQRRESVRKEMIGGPY